MIATSTLSNGKIKLRPVILGNWNQYQQILCTSGNFSSCTGLHRSAQTWAHSSVNFSQLHRPAQHLKLLKTKKNEVC